MTQNLLVFEAITFEIFFLLPILKNIFLYFLTHQELYVERCMQSLSIEHTYLCFYDSVKQ